jgi:hypothetical protein
MAKPVLNERKCRVCGCTDNHACPGGCYWVEPGLCSVCAGFPSGPPDEAEDVLGHLSIFLEDYSHETEK